jgi:nitrite reductase/ring-hydroxylating ferredoxin subunit
VVCPYDGTNLKAVEVRPSLADTVPMRCPACGRRFELARGNVIEQPSAGTEDDSKA